MTPTESPTAFTTFAAASGVAVQSSSVRDGLEHMFSFFQSSPAAGCAGPDGDMLLFQWGTYDWGDGLHFEINMTRQFIEQDLEDDDAISQLSLTYRFSPTPEYMVLGEGNRWCRSRAEIAAFRAFVLSSAPYAAVQGIAPAGVELDHSYV